MLLQEDVLDAIREERVRQDIIHPKPTPPTLGKFLAIIVEEVGEVAEAILDLQTANAVGSRKQRVKARDHLVEELVQTAAAVVAMVETL